ncbi:MAG: ABC transporter permease [Gammaproteobacteria bacterium]|nr:ABC transporter permease [Gammaproteobacteria bacterium]MBQ0840339.1 ABC transporter permease [Gammaproteobacteria bacterium]
MSMLSRAMAIAHKETKELLRDKVYLGMAFAVPVVLLLLFGYGLSLDVKHLPIAFQDNDRSAISRDYIDSFVHSEYFDLISTTDSAEEVERMFAAGRVRVVIDIPADFSRQLTSLAPVSVGVTIDGSFPARAGVIQAYVGAINAQYNASLLRDFVSDLGLGDAISSPVGVDMSYWYNPSLESINMVVPGMLVLILMLFPAILGSLVVVREKEAGTIYNLYACPARRWEILLGKALPYITVSFLDYLLIFAMSIWLFDVRFIGDFWVLSIAALLYSICTVGIGLLFSVLVRTQLAAMLLTFLTTVTPAFNYSGFLSPVSSMDSVGQGIAYLIPATYFMEMVRGVYLKGLGFDYYWPALLTLAAYTVVIYSISLLVFRKRVG